MASKGIIFLCSAPTKPATYLPKNLSRKRSLPLTNNVTNTQVSTTKKNKLEFARTATPSNKASIVESQDFGEPISLGTMKLPTDIDLNRMESLLFQWGNSLTQSANLPLPAPLKVDKVKGGVRLGFITVTGGKVEDLVHIDCLVFPADNESPVPMFRALRNGKLKNQRPPGEDTIMRKLLEALKKSVQIAKI